MLLRDLWLSREGDKPEFLTTFVRGDVGSNRPIPAGGTLVV